ncbi:hypothetical protein WT21_04985 [Burkholderia territorii]|nr:hypothetical protein WT21_04985 [Burkholderia territorii]
MRGLVTAAAAGQDRDGALRWLGQRLAHEHLLIAENRDMRRLPRDPFEHFAHDVGRVVHELLHGSGFLTMGRSPAARMQRRLASYCGW